MSRSSASLRRPVAAAAVALTSLVAAGAVALPATAADAAHRGTPAAKTPATSLSQLAATRTLTATRGTGTATGTATEGVSLQLTPRNRAGLAALATAHGLSHATRMARLAPLLPGTARANAVAATLHRDGLTITSTSALSVNAAGPSTTVDALFGSVATGALRTAQALPRIPAALQGLVTVAYGSADTRPAELPLGLTTRAAVSASSQHPVGGGKGGTLTVGQARGMYGTAPSTASPTASSPIIATLQFTSQAVVSQAVQNATNFATKYKLYADSSYVASSNITEVPVNAGCTANAGAEDGDEVGLDQETLLTVAPQLRQRIYTVNNCGNSQDLALDQVVTDVQNGMPIIALSSSWGECEVLAYSGSSKTADIDAVNSLLAAGVTMFAASGDSGSNDCGIAPARDAVDTPAALPGVVAVGGTTGVSTTALQVTNEDLGGGFNLSGGGGFSCGYFPRPSYQASVAKAASYPHNTALQGFAACKTGSSERMVPDISEDAGDGLYTMVTDASSDGCPPADNYTCSLPILGTSFAAPLAAGGFATYLANRNVTSGIGDIHSFLYAKHGFYDVKAGNNGDYAATTGYDVGSGVGSPVWSQVLSSGGDLQDVSVDSTTGAVSVRSAFTGDDFLGTTGELSTGLTLSDPANWQFVIAPYGGDAAADLWAVHLGGTAGTELEVLSQSSGYKSVLTDRTLPTSGYPEADVQVRVAPYAGDKASDLYVIQTTATPSTKVEVNVLSAVSGFQTWTVHHRSTAITAGQADWTFLVGDSAGSGNLVGVLDGGTSSGKTEVHILSRSSGYQTYTLHAKTPLAEYNGNPAAQFSLRDVSGDGAPDVVLALLSGTTSNSVEVHALAAPSFSTFVYQRATGLATAPSTDTVALAE